MCCQYATGISSRTGGFQNNFCCGSFMQPTLLGLMQQTTRLTAPSLLAPNPAILETLSFRSHQKRHLAPCNDGWEQVQPEVSATALKSPSHSHDVNIRNCSAHLHTCSSYDLASSLSSLACLTQSYLSCTDWLNAIPQGSHT